MSKVNMTLMIIVLIPILFIVAATPAYADGGGPILLLASFFLFVIGQVWIILSEFIYMKFLHKGISWLLILKTVTIMNLVSMVLGGLALPFLLAIIGLLGAMISSVSFLKTFGEYLFAVGTWVAGDNSPHATIALVSAGVGFIGTYFITVYVERWYLNRQVRKNKFPYTSLINCYSFNAISYLGLVILLYTQY